MKPTQYGIVGGKTVKLAAYSAGRRCPGCNKRITNNATTCRRCRGRCVICGDVADGYKLYCTIHAPRHDHEDVLVVQGVLGR